MKKSKTKIIKNKKNKKSSNNTGKISDSIYKEIVLQGVDGMLVADSKTREFKFCNPAMCKMTGYSHDELLKMRVDDLHPKESLEYVFGEFAAQARGKKHLAENIPCLKKNGTIIYADIKSVNIKIDNREYVSGIFREITYKKQAEEALKHSEMKHKILYDSSRDAIMTLKGGENFLGGNAATLEMFGCKDEKEFTSRSPSDFSPEYQPDGKLSEKKAQEMMNKALKEGSNFFEWTHKRMDGSEFFATVLLTRIELEGVPLLQATVRDITENKQLQEDMLKIEKMAAIGTMAFSVAHELRNPLGVVKTAVYNLDHHLKEKDERTKRHILNINKKLDIANHIISDLLNFARLGKPTFSKVNVAELLNEELDLIAEKFNGNIKIVRKYSASLDVVVDKVQFAQVIQNILKNAFESIEGKGKVVLSTEYCEKEKLAKIKISDNGCGISKHNFKKLARPFFTTKPKGVGLGLALSFRIVEENHGGKIEVVSEKDKGSTFTIILPRVKR